MKYSCTNLRAPYLGVSSKTMMYLFVDEFRENWEIAFLVTIIQCNYNNIKANSVIFIYVYTS